MRDCDLPLREALRLVDYDKTREERATRRESGDPVQLGIGIYVYVEITGVSVSRCPMVACGDRLTTSYP